MKVRENYRHVLGEVGDRDRLARVLVGLISFIVLLHLMITTTTVYPYLSILLVLIVLSGIAGWDPIYAAFQFIERKLSGLTLFGRKPFQHAH